MHYGELIHVIEGAQRGETVPCHVLQVAVANLPKTLPVLLLVACAE